MPDLPSGHSNAFRAVQPGAGLPHDADPDAAAQVTALPAGSDARKSGASLDYIWSAVGIVAVLVGGYMLYGLLSRTSPHDVSRAFTQIPPHRWVLAVCGTLLAYAALAWYDRIALLHLGKPLNWLFISLTSFTTYALSHNVGASVFSGAAVRYRAYSTKGLSAAEVGVLVALTSFTFTLGNLLLAAIVLIGDPELVTRLLPISPLFARSIGFATLGVIALYVLGSWLAFPPLDIRGFKLFYPRLPIALRQLVAAPIELIGAAAIIYFAMPAQGNPGFFVVLGVFIIAFSAGLISHAPGGLGVFEFSFFKLLPGLTDDQKAGVLAALFVWRLLYLMIPLALGIVIVMIFEKGRYAAKAAAAQGVTAGDQSGSGQASQGQASQGQASQGQASQGQASQGQAPSNVVRLDPMAKRKPR
jgi:glycosyltransferase 2 family protein